MIRIELLPVFIYLRCRKEMWKNYLNLTKEWKIYGIIVNFIIQHPNYDCCHVIAILNLSFSAHIRWVHKAYSTEYIYIL